jgi:hypothetical protein
MSKHAQGYAGAKPGLRERLVQSFAAALDDALIWWYRHIWTGYRNCGPIQRWARTHRGKIPEPDRKPNELRWTGVIGQPDRGETPEPDREPNERRDMALTSHMHVSGDTIGLHPDVCARCGHDIRHPVHCMRKSRKEIKKRNPKG